MATYDAKRLRPLCRLDVFGLVPGAGRKPGLIRAGWQDWHASPRDERRDARLPGAGSFYYANPRKAWRRARVILRAYPLVQSIRVETISGRRVGRIGRGFAYAGE